MEINSHHIALRGKAELPEPLALGEGYTVILEGEVTSVSEHNNQNGTKDVSYSFKPALATIEDRKGKVIKARDMRSRSQQLRRMLKAAWESDPDGGLDHEASYDDTMKFIISLAYDLYEKAKQAKKKDGRSA
jgi:hypothetical protein